MKVLILGSGPAVVNARNWPRDPFDLIVTINNAWQLRPDRDILVHPEDFPSERRPTTITPGQRVIGANDYVPANNVHGGIIYAGGTMAFSTGYWVLETLRPRVVAYFGCDMVYRGKNTRFYGAGTADPLRADPTLQDLHAKSSRLELIAAYSGCAVVNLSQEETRLSFVRSDRADCERITVPKIDRVAVETARAAEKQLGAYCPSGCYWEDPLLDATSLAKIDALWSTAWRVSRDLGACWGCPALC